ncbi:DUF488 domain-containing protein [Aurantimonas marianensis]|uniref:DUF488 domain-containing protein n=1 Tax=Aurantimonas marianensis TaxID=2920428 RepID=UPI00311A957F
MAAAGRDPPGQSNGQRVLIARLWPRGISKDGLKLEEWAEVAPRDALRDWCGQDDVILVYAAKDTAHNNAVALKRHPEKRQASGTKPAMPPAKPALRLRAPPRPGRPEARGCPEAACARSRGRRG